LLRNTNNFNKFTDQPKILIAPLDWGLGHATRCIPLIARLLALNCKVFIAADKQIFTLLQKEFPSAVFLRLKGYEIRYSRNKKNFFLKMLFQFPKIAGMIRNEKKWVKKMVKEYKINAIISDNRFGFYSKNVLSIYITHQLFIETGNYFTSIIATKIHRFFIKKYSHCWVPDFKENGFAGKLSHPEKIPSNVTYIGPLSRFTLLPSVETIYDVFISISGPEPQRTIFENIIYSQLKNFKGKALVVRGLPAEKVYLNQPGQSIEIMNHLSSTDFNKCMQQSKLVICRSGYTTIMDLVKLKKSAVLVPTPGQKEQEYLADFLSEKKYFVTVPQEDFSLQNILNSHKTLPVTYPDFSLETYKPVIDEFVLSLKKSNFAPQ